MPKRKRIQGVLGNLLGSFVSRNSDFHGYWLLGFLVEDLDIDLLAVPPAVSDDPIEKARELAGLIFSRQLANARLHRSLLHSARLEIRRQGGVVSRLVDQAVREGSFLLLTASAQSDLGTWYLKRQSLFVAPHDPSLERRSTRADS